MSVRTLTKALVRFSPKLRGMGKYFVFRFNPRKYAVTTKLTKFTYFPAYNQKLFYMDLSSKITRKSKLWGNLFKTKVAPKYSLKVKFFVLIKGLRKLQDIFF